MYVFKGEVKTFGSKFLVTKRAIKPPAGRPAGAPRVAARVDGAAAALGGRWCRGASPGNQPMPTVRLDRSRASE